MALPNCDLLYVLSALSFTKQLPFGLQHPLTGFVIAGFCVIAGIHIFTLLFDSLKP